MAGGALTGKYSSQLETANLKPKSFHRMATARFHHPFHAKESASPTINQEFDIVWNLILSGIVK